MVPLTVMFYVVIIFYIPNTKFTSQNVLKLKGEHTFDCIVYIKWNKILLMEEYWMKELNG